MNGYIIKVRCDGVDYYLEWSGVADAPLTTGMLLPDFLEYYREEYGADGMARLPERLHYVDLSGTSDRVCRDPVETWIEGNRAGDDGAELSFAELVDRYVRAPRKAAAK